MTRKKRIFLIAGGSLLGLIVLIVIAGVITVQTAWFQNFVREKIITAVEDATGGKVDIAAFSFDWHRLRAQVRGFVVHGLEPAGTPPLLQARLLQVDLKLLSPFKGFVDIAALLVDTPQADVIIFPDGRTNIPAPKVKQSSSSDKSGLETVVNLAVGHFDLVNGSLIFADRKSQFNASGENLRANLGYQASNPSYTGEIDLSPLHLKSGNNPPLDLNIQLPITLEKDKISVANARLTTPQSQVTISASMDHMLAPRYAGQLRASLALDEIRRAAGLTMPLDTVRGPRTANLDLAASADNRGYQIQRARLNIGQSDLEANGGADRIQFTSNLDLTELGRLLRLAEQPQGNVRIGGNAALNAGNNYLIRANVNAHGLSFRQSSVRVTGLDLDSAVTADPHRIDLNGLRLSVLGGTLTGSGSLLEMAQFRFTGDLRSFDLSRVSQPFVKQPLGYDGILSGSIQADGNVKASSALVARANLAIAPGPRGIPVSGRLNVDYNGRGDTVTLGQSYLALPNTRLDLAGSLGRQIQVRLVSRNLADFQPVAVLPITFSSGGNAALGATVTGSLSNPRINGHLAVTNFAVEGRQFTRFGTDFNAARSGAAITNAALARGSLEARFSASVGLRNWKAEPFEPLMADLTIRNSDLQDVLALAGQSSLQGSGALTADAHLTGTVGDPRGSADFSLTGAALAGQHFDSASAQVVFTQGAINLPSLAIVNGPSRLDANATYQHAPDDLKSGVLQGHVATSQIQLATFQALVKDRPGLKGTLTLNADFSGNAMPIAGNQEFQIASLNANLSARGLEMQGKTLGDLTATANTAGNAIQYNVNSDFAGSTIRVNGQSLLAGTHQTTATAAITNLPIDRVLAIAGRSDLPVTGILTANAELSGTTQDPRANGTFVITRGSAYQQPIDRLEAKLAYSNVMIDVPSFRLNSGAASLDLNASFSHPAGNLEDGQVRFEVRSNQVQLATIRAVEQFRPGLAGTLQLSADGAAALQHNQAPLFSTLNAAISARGLRLNQTALGDLSANAVTKGREVTFDLKSDFARSNINGSGRMELAGDYPLNAQVRFSNVTYSGLSPLLGPSAVPGLEASTDGEVSLSGPVAKTENLRASLQISKIEAHSTPPGAGVKPRVNLELHNQGPIVAALDNSVINIQSAHLTGPDTNLTITGTAALNGQGSINLRADASTKLTILEAFSPNIFSAGNISFNATVTGTTAKPAVNGRLELQNASVNMLNVPNGISNANGAVVFTSTEATIQNITGESGGGKITLAGFVAYAGPQMQFRVQANAKGVHVNYPQSVTTEADAQITFTGNTARSVVGGTVSILNVVLHPESDVGSMLSQAAAPPAAPTSSTGLLAGITFDVRVQTAPDVQFRTTLTENLQADADVTLRGTIDHPGMIGRITVTQGNVVFFGSKYSIDQGTISFFDPSKINPILNIDLETMTQGIDVSLSVSGPMDRMKLSYRSDPPLRFDEIVSLLASGKTPTTDPVIAAHQPAAPQQSLEQTGMSTLLGQAVANPVSGRLQRLFGVTKLQINPLITGTGNTPQATLTLQQQISNEITFTYIQDVAATNPLTIRMEWAINPQWSAIAQRDIYGQLDLNFYWKKRFW